MKVVALVSGGKDSCYAMMKCIQYGHEIVALANLIPADDATDELDSYMYQTDMVTPKIEGYKAVQLQTLERDALVFEATLVPFLPNCPPDASKDNLSSFLVT
ncbi:hypothetical protein MTR67_016793 [Solanum verrucosum]|uniref:Diphthine--ammonia ligase n=1 Tax=Solanum verrucosum TaxID=315347 RepID=A0AAF0TR50_SOLVR|nr:hypothetical protein MTR67_016793 [Solanum verrucosum]